MPRCLTLLSHLPDEDVERRYRQSRDLVERALTDAVAGRQGYTSPAVATLPGFSEDWVRIIVHRYNAESTDGVRNRRQVRR